MSFREIVGLENIESALQNIWEKLAEKNTTRASLFNLIVFAKIGSRTDYSQKVVAKLVEKFPCRVLFISWDPTAKEEFLKAAVSVFFLEEKGFQTACDHIDIGVSTQNLSHIPSLLLPHFIPDLPIYLLWAEEFSYKDPLFQKLQKLSDRVIFDSEVFDDFSLFLRNLSPFLTKNQGFSDLNWIRTEVYRDMISSHFSSKERRESLATLKRVIIQFNSHTSSYFSHVKIQALYLQAWIASCLSLVKKQETETLIEYEKGIFFELVKEDREDLPPAALSNLEIQTENTTYIFTRKEKETFLIKSITKESCELPYTFRIERGILGLSLSKEIMNKGVSSHYTKMLPLLGSF